MNNIKSYTVCKGDVEAIISYSDGIEIKKYFENTVLSQGKAALAKSLANEQNSPYDFYISGMTFGNNGSVSGVPKEFDDSRTGLFGPTLITKNVISNISTSAPTTLICTAVLTFADINGYSLSEMGLLMKNGQLYSMVTFPDLGKTSNMQITFNWSVSFL